MTRAFIFPGQGSQAVGMGLALSQGFAAARLVFEEVDEALKQKLSKLMFEGPESELTLTENAQPALMAVSIAALRVLEADGGWRLADKASFVAGHSLGEYSALAAAGALGLSDAARLLKLRGQAMQKAVPVGVGAMAALLGPDLEQVQKIARQAADETKKVCGVANDNSPGQVVVSGAKEAVERAIAIAHRAGREAQHHAAGERAVPLRADAARRRRDGRGAGQGDHPAAVGAGGGQRDGAAGERCRRRSPSCWWSR